MAKNTKSLLHFDDNISNSKNLVFTMHGNPKIKSDKFAIGTRSLYLDGSSYLNVSSPDFNFGTGDFTIEFYAYPTSLRNQGCIQLSNTAGGFQYNTTGNLALALGDNYSRPQMYAANQGVPGTNPYTANQWIHIAIVRYNGITTLYQDGTSIASIADTVNYTVPNMVLGSMCIADFSFIGYLDEVRISKIARYTANFTPSTVPFVEDANTVLLLHFEDREDLSVLRDEAGVVWTMVGGTPDISAAQSKVLHGKSLYIPSAGTTYGITTPSPLTDDFKFGSEDFTVEMFVYPTVQLSGQGYLYTTNAIGYYENLGILLNNTTQVQAFVSVTGNSWSNCYCDGVLLNQWNHISVNRKGNEMYCTLNGIKGTASAISGSIVNTTSSHVKIGSYYTGASSNFIGYIDEVRVMKGKAKYTENYTVPEKLNLEWNNVAYLTNDDKLYGKVGYTFTKLSDTYSAMTSADAKLAIDSTDTNTATIAELQSIGAFKILSSDINSDKTTGVMSVVNKDTLITPKSLILLKSIEGIDKVSLNRSITGTGSCRLLVTNDLTTYKTFDGTNFVDIDHTDINAIKTNGIDPSALATITREKWDTLTVGKIGIGFAYLPTIEEITDTYSIADISMTADMKGSWDKAKEANYDYGYPVNDLLRVKINTDGSYKINYRE